MLQFCYPRLDVNVSKGLNHLLKAPFSVHPKTGRVCIPITIEKIYEFDPTKVVTIYELNDAIEKYEKSHAEQNDAEVPLYQKTPLKPSIDLFNDFVKRISEKSIQAKKIAASMSMEF